MSYSIHEKNGADRALRRSAGGAAATRIEKLFSVESCYSLTVTCAHAWACYFSLFSVFSRSLYRGAANGELPLADFDPRMGVESVARPGVAGD